jgi:hypothetical protein
MSNTNNPSPPQFNTYKHTELWNKLEPILQDQSPHRIKKAREILQECCWCRNLQELAIRWQPTDILPSPPPTSLSLLHYNIRNFYSNQAELLEMVSSLSPPIISLNELGTVVPIKTIKQLLFSYQVYATEGTNAHGRAVLAIEKGLKPLPIEISDLNMVAAKVTIDCRSFVVASVYSPPTERLPLSAMTTLLKQSKNVIIAGDFNAKHPE